MITEVGSPGLFGGIVVAPVREPVDVKTTTPGFSEAVKVTVAFDMIVPPLTTSVVVSHSVQVLLERIKIVYVESPRITDLVLVETATFPEH